MGWFGYLTTAAQAFYYVWKYGSKFDQTQKEHPDWSFPRCIKAVFPDIPKLVVDYIVRNKSNSVKSAVTPAITEHQQKIYWDAEEQMQRELKDMEDNWDNW